MAYFLKTYTVGLLLLLAVRPLSAQEKIDVIVLNAEDKEPVAFATISFPKLQYGFSANADGHFRFPVDQSNIDQTLVVSSIGFEKFESKVRDLMQNKTDTILLHPKITLLKEITIKADRETAGDLMKNAEDELEVFLRKDPYYLFGFYTESIKKNDVYSGYTEAYGVFQISGYQPAYNRKNRLFSYDISQWKNIRRSNYDLPSECDSGKKRLLEIDKLIRAKSEYLYNGPFSKTNRNNFRYTIDSATTFDNTDVFVIGFTPLSQKSPAYKGRAYIKIDDYALLRMEVDDDNGADILYNDCKINSISSNFTITFTKVGDKYYLKDASLKTSYTVNTDHIQENINFLGGEFKDNSVASLNHDQRVILYNEMLNPLIIYEPNFWADQDRKLPDDVANELGGKKSLQEQFLANNNKRIIPLPQDFSSYEEMQKQHDIWRMLLNADY